MQYSMTIFMVSRPVARDAAVNRHARTPSRARMRLFTRAWQQPDAPKPRLHRGDLRANLLT
jgi:hypothetical protein